MNTRLMSARNIDEHFEYDVQDEISAWQFIPGMLISLMVIALLATIALKLADPSTLPIRNVSVTGEFVHLSPVSLQQRVSEVVRGGFFNVNVETIKQVLLEEPWVREVSVKRVWPDRITVNIREQTAVAQWGENGLLNSDASLFQPDRASFPTDLPLLDGPNNSTDDVLRKLEQIRELLPAGLDVDELVLSARRSWRLKLDNGLTIRPGKTGPIERTGQFFEYFPIKDINNFENIKYVDMRYTNGFVIRWNPDLKTEPQNRQGTHGEEI